MRWRTCSKKPRFHSLSIWLYRKIPYIQLLSPNGDKRGIVETEHKSLWRYPDKPFLLSGLSAELYTDEQRQLIETLITENAWIVEESNDLIRLV